MAQNDELKVQVVENCVGWKKNVQFQEKHARIRVFQKLQPEVLVDLLLAPKRAVKTKAKKLLTKMAEMRWTLNAAPHEGGREDDPNADPALHITIRVDGAYHLRCGVGPRGLYIYQISKGGGGGDE